MKKRCLMKKIIYLKKKNQPYFLNMKIYKLNLKNFRKEIKKSPSPLEYKQIHMRSLLIKNQWK